MASNKNFVWIAASLLAGALCAFSAAAETHRPEAYEQLTAVQLQPGVAPQAVHGMDTLGSREDRHKERLPLQLRGAMEKVKKVEYRPSGKARRQETRSKRRSLSKPSKPARAAAKAAPRRKLRQEPSFRENLKMPGSLPQNVKRVAPSQL